MISQVTDQLFIGKAKLVYQPEALHELGITSVVKLYEWHPIWADGFRVLDSPFPDGEHIASERLAAFDQHIAAEISAGERVLVVCGAGMSRSATVVLSYLVASGMGLHEAYDLLWSKHHDTLPHPYLWRSLIEHHGLQHTLAEVMAWRRA
jgi:hypothetical protein